MAVALSPGRAKTVALTTAVVRLTGIETVREVVVVAPAAAAVAIVDDPAVADGAALPADYLLVPAGTVFIYRRAPGTAYIGLAAASGTPSATVRAL